MSEYSAPTQFIDLSAQQEKIRDNIDIAIHKVLNHGQYIMGPEVQQFENSLKEFSRSKYAFTCANGTDAITIALMAWGIGPGDTVIVPSFTYVASAEAPAQLGAIPFFVDVQEDTFNIDPSSFKQAILDCRAQGLNPSVVIVVDLFGQPADIDAITDIAKSEGIKVLIDSAQSFGGSSKNRRVGSMGDITTTSFFPAKPLGCYGDGGAIFTQSDEYAELINSIRLHGKGSEKYDNIRIGLNSRLDTIQAAVLIEKLKIFPGELANRSDIANKYNDCLKNIFKIPVLKEDTTSAWAQYTIISDDRENDQSKLKSVGIPSVIYYPIPLSRQLGYNHFPSVSSGTGVSERLSKNVLSLPMHPYIDKDSHELIIEKILSVKC